jgi:hypothetical protein
MYSPTLYASALNLSRQLDEALGRPRTVTLSQKDVPGMTRAAVPQLAAAGIRAIHIGEPRPTFPPPSPFPLPYLTNSSFRRQRLQHAASGAPLHHFLLQVPSSSPEYFGNCNVFRWLDEASNSSVLAYYGSAYGQGEPSSHILPSSPLLRMPSPSLPPFHAYGLTAGASTPSLAVTVPGFDEAMVFLFHVDNTGPQSADQVSLDPYLFLLLVPLLFSPKVQQAYRATGAVYPGAQLLASTIDTFTHALLASPAVNSLPVVTSELGDT